MSNPSRDDSSTASVQHAPSETASTTATMPAFAAHDPREEIRGAHTLAAVKSLSSAGNLIVFDFASLSPEALSEDGIKKLREQMGSNHPAEPTRFGIPQGKLDLFLANRGFRIVELLGPEPMEARYLTLRDGSVMGRVPRLFNLVVAQVDKPAIA